MSKIDIKVDYTTLLERSNPGEWLYSYILSKSLSDGVKIYKTTFSGNTLQTVNSIHSFVEELLSTKSIYNLITAKSEEKFYINLSTHTYARLYTTSKTRDNNKVEMKVVTADKNILTKTLAWARENIQTVTGNNVYTIGQSTSGLTLQELGKMSNPIARHNYTSQVLEKTDHAIKQLNSVNPQGRLIIINGEAGTGKTHLIKGLVPSIEKSLIVLLPTKLVSEVDGPALVSLLSDWKNEYGFQSDDGRIEHTDTANLAIVFIIEDADECLTTRDAHNMSQVSSMLNNTDGILGSLLDLRIIATTNAGSLDFDKAFTRPGRLCVHITLDKLSPEHATEAYEKITEGKKKIYRKPVTLAEVYADVNENPYGYTHENAKLGFT